MIFLSDHGYEGYHVAPSLFSASPSHTTIIWLAEGRDLQPLKLNLLYNFTCTQFLPRCPGTVMLFPFYITMAVEVMRAGKYHFRDMTTYNCNSRFIFPGCMSSRILNSCYQESLTDLHVFNEDMMLAQRLCDRVYGDFVSTIPYRQEYYPQYVDLDILDVPDDFECVEFPSDTDSWPVGCAPIPRYWYEL